MLFVRLYDLRLFGFVCFLFLLVSGKAAVCDCPLPLGVWERAAVCDCGTPWIFLLLVFAYEMMGNKVSVNCIIFIAVNL